MIALALAVVLSAADSFTPWKLDLQLSCPQAVVVAGPGAAARAVWYIPFTVTNKTGAARTIAPFVTLTTDTAKSYGATYDPEALKGIRTVLGEDVVDLFDLTGTIEDGATKRGVACFSGVDRMANGLTLSFAGFASPVVRKGATYSQNETRYVASYRRPGNEFRVISHPTECASAGWVTVATKKIR